MEIFQTIESNLAFQITTVYKQTKNFSFKSIVTRIVAVCTIKQTLGTLTLYSKGNFYNLTLSN
jgi:hypothetical protein